MAPLLLGRVVQEVDKMREAMRAVELLSSVVPGDVAGSLRDVVRRAVQLWHRLQCLWRTESCRGDLPSLLLKNDARGEAR